MTEVLLLFNLHKFGQFISEFHCSFCHPYGKKSLTEDKDLNETFDSISFPVHCLIKCCSIRYIRENKPSENVTKY